MVVSLSQGSSSSDESYLNEICSEKMEGLYVMQTSMNAISDKGDVSFNLIVPENADKLNDFIRFRTRITQSEVEYPNQNGVVITEKLASMLGVGAGDKITVSSDIYVSISIFLCNPAYCQLIFLHIIARYCRCV